MNHDKKTSTYAEPEGAVVLLFGPQPIHILTKHSGQLGKDAVMETNVARMAGATIAMGSPAALDHLREKLIAGVFQEVRSEFPQLSEAAVQWLATGRRGSSSETMFQVLTGATLRDEGDFSHPHDASDFWRCRNLLDQVPELAERLPQMASISPVWAELVNQWSHVCESMDRETDGNWRNSGIGMPKTSELVRSIVRAPSAMEHSASIRRSRPS